MLFTASNQSWRPLCRMATKTLLLMKLAAFIICITCLQVSAGAFSQTLNLSVKDAPVEKVFNEIRLQTGYSIVYNNSLLKNAHHVSIEGKNLPLETVLALSVKNQKFTYVLREKVIVIKPAHNMDAISAQPMAQNAERAVTGRVEDEEGNRLQGVSVVLKRSGKGTITDANGSFTLQQVDDTDVLVFSFVGFEQQQIQVLNRNSFFLRLKRSEKSLDETIVVGYGTTTRRLNTGSVARVTAKEIAAQPVTNVLQALQGRMPGMFIQQSNGLPGAAMTVQIRGANSLAKSNTPFYIVDGVPFLSESINRQSTADFVLGSAEGAASPLNILNPSDIESIEVLKDADATAIYGSRGANGVVLITTKKGKAGKTSFNMNIQSGRSKATNMLDLMKTEEYLALRRQAFAANGAPINATTAPDLVTWDQNAYTDFQKLLLGGSAHTTDISASLSGGDIRTNFLFSGTYHDESNIYPGAQGYSRYGLNLSMNHRSLDQRLKLGVAAIYSSDKNNISVTDLARLAYELPPNFPLYNPDGTLYWTGVIGGKTNPLAYLNQANTNVSTNLLSNLDVRYNLFKGFEIKTTLGYSKTDMDQVQLFPLSSMDPSISFNQPRSNFSYNVTQNYIVEPQASYNTNIWKGKLEILAGGTWQFSKSKMPFYMTASGFASDEFIRNPSSATTLTARTASQDYKFASLFTRINYNIENKYLLNLVDRRDGSSRFGPGNRFGNFGSIGAAWIFTEENWMKGLPVLSFGKLRGSYGLVGSDFIGNYAYLATYQPSTYVYNGTPGLVPSRLPNGNFQWEETRKLEVALELGFLDDDIMLTASAYRNRTGNQLVNYAISAQAGFTTYQANLPALVENRGLEFTLNTNNIDKKDFKWSSSINISFNENELVAFPGIERTSYYSQFLVGHPISGYYVYQYKGINATTGLPEMEDLNKDNAVSFGLAATGRGDRYFAGSQMPDFHGGLLNNLSYKGFDLSLFFQFVKKDARSLLGASFYPPGAFYNGSAQLAQDYLALGDPDKLVSAVTSTPSGLAAFRAYSTYTGSDAALRDASFIRFKNLSLGYTVPAGILKGLKLQRARLFVSGQNLFIITGYDGYDPESATIATPPLRTLMGGIQLTF